MFYSCFVQNKNQSRPCIHLLRFCDIYENSSASFNIIIIIIWQSVILSLYKGFSLHTEV